MDCCEDCGGPPEVWYDDDTWTCSLCSDERKKRIAPPGYTFTKPLSGLMAYDAKGEKPILLFDDAKGDWYNPLSDGRYADVKVVYERDDKGGFRVCESETRKLNEHR